MPSRYSLSPMLDAAAGVYKNSKHIKILSACVLLGSLLYYLQYDGCAERIVHQVCRLHQGVSSHRRVFTVPEQLPSGSKDDVGNIAGIIAIV